MSDGRSRSMRARPKAARTSAVGRFGPRTASAVESAAASTVVSAVNVPKPATDAASTGSLTAPSPGDVKAGSGWARADVGEPGPTPPSSLVPPKKPTRLKPAGSSPPIRSAGTRISRMPSMKPTNKQGTPTSQRVRAGSTSSASRLRRVRQYEPRSVRPRRDAERRTDRAQARITPPVAHPASGSSRLLQTHDPVRNRERSKVINAC